MGSLNPENEPNLTLDDSGYVQDDTSAKEASPAEELIKGSTNLLDLSDDVLLYILKYCSPRDLKALGYTCSRLGTLILDRTLWQYVDAREFPTGRSRMQWLLTHALSVHTTSLLLTGYAREAKGCLGFMSGSRDDVPLQGGIAGPVSNSEAYNLVESGIIDEEEFGRRLMRLSAQAFPRCSNFPFWSEETARSQRGRESKKPEQTGENCPGPQVTLTRAALLRLTTLCTNLVELALDYVIIDCNMTKVSFFPLNLRKLSMRGTKCFNLEKSFFHKIQDRLLYLEDLDVSYCEWIEPASMLPLSKMQKLTRLIMQECLKLSEFVAYASLATRYGFKTLKILDLRGCPVGDSEVSALGWLPQLEQLFLSPATPRPRHADHAHFSKDPLPAFTELDRWEDEEPDYYKSKYSIEQWIQDEINDQPNRLYEGDDIAIGSCILLQSVADRAQPSQSTQNAPHRVRSVEYVPAFPFRREIYTIDFPRENRVQLSRDERIIADEIREREREQQQARGGSSMGYIISNSGCSRRTMNMYPVNETEQNPSSSNDTNNQSASNKRKNEDESDAPAKRQKDVSVQMSNGSETSNEQRSDPASSRIGPSGSKEPCATKASRKYYDDAANCQISRAVLKDTWNDFKKRTEGLSGPIYKPPQDDNPKPDFVDSDDDPSNMANDEDDDDDEDDDKPQPKRSRVAINDGASSSQSQNDGGHRSNASSNSQSSQQQPGCSTTNPSSTTAGPSRFSTEPSCSSTQPSRSSTQPSRSSTQPSRSSTQPSRNPTEPNSNSAASNEITDTLNQFVLSDLIPLQPELPFIMMSDSDESNGPEERSKKESNDSGGPSTSNGNGQPKGPQKFVRFSVNEPPVVVEGCAAYNNNDAREPDWNNRSLGRRDTMISGLAPDTHLLRNSGSSFPQFCSSRSSLTLEPNVPPENAANNEGRRHRILCVNVGRHRHAMYQISMPEPIDLTRRPATAHMNLLYSSQVATRLHYTSLVTDAAIRRFGRADGERINYVQIGPMGAMPAPFEDPTARPNRSNLRVLSVTGFGTITNHSLTHLVTAAPHLQFIDFTGTRVTETGVQHFRNLRPDCRIKYGSFETPKEDFGRPHSR